MKLLRYQRGAEARLGVLAGDDVVDLLDALAREQLGQWRDTVAQSGFVID